MRFPFTLIAVLPLLAACGGVEGHYAIDRERTAAGMERKVEEQVAEAGVQAQGKDAQAVDQVRKAMKEELHKALAQMAIDLHVERGGRLTASAKVAGETGTMEGTWTLRGDILEITTTHEDGEKKESPKTESLHYRDGRLSFDDPDSEYPFLVLSKQ